LLDFDPMVILRATSILGGQKEDKRIICNIPHFVNFHFMIGVGVFEEVSIIGIICWTFDLNPNFSCHY
jgi:hypothetical protein